jgi:SAM-dependent methyltransferase
MSSSVTIQTSQCLVCGSKALEFYPILWDGLVREWGLTPEEAAYIDRQQGLSCQACGTNLRSMALALSIMRQFGYCGYFKDFVRKRVYRQLRVLEVNEAGTLSPFLRQSRRHVIARYPEYDMTQLAFGSGTFDLVVHSDTLEHVPDPVLGLTECGRVLAEDGACCYTVPIVVGRLTRSRAGLEPSYHGREVDRTADYLVHTEFGADAWTLPLRAGFRECRLMTVEYPTAQALACLK